MKFNKRSFLTSIEKGEEEIDVEVIYSGYYDRGVSYGAPENCYPEEGEIEIDAVYELDIVTDKAMKSVDLADNMSYNELEKLEQEAWEDFFDNR